MASDARPSPASPAIAGIGFRIEEAVGINVLTWDDNGCRPATEEEVLLWNALCASTSTPRPCPDCTDAGQVNPNCWLCDGTNLHPEVRRGS